MFIQIGFFEGLTNIFSSMWDLIFKISILVGILLVILDIYRIFQTEKDVVLNVLVALLGVCLIAIGIFFGEPENRTIEAVFGLISNE